MVLFFVYVFRQFSNLAIQNKVLVSILMVALLSVLTISVSVNYVTRRALFEESGNDIKKIAGREAVAFGELLLQQIRIMETAALNPQLEAAAIEKNESYGDNSEGIILAQLEALDRIWRVVSESNEYVAPLLSNDIAFDFSLIQNKFPENAEIFATDKFGGLIGSTNKTTDYYQADENWWIAAYNNGQGAVYIGDPDFDSSTGTLALIVAVPIYARTINNKDGREVLGVLRTTLDLDRLNEILELSNISVGSESINIYINDSLELMFQEDGQVQIQEPLPETGFIVQNLVESGDLYQPVPRNGENTITSLSSVRTHEEVQAILDLNWYVVISRLETDVLATVSQQTQITILLSIATVSLSAVAALILGQRLTSPIVKLTEIAQQIEAGDRLIRAEITNNDEVGQLASALNKMTTELGTVLNQLELRVASRTRALQIASDVSRELSSILDLDELLLMVVTLVRDAYDYYHAQIYLWNEDKTKLVMRRGSGEAGTNLLVKSHQMNIGMGLVGKAAETKSPLFVANVRDGREAIGWIPNPELPDTVSEVAIPIFSGNDVIGVLDVQENELGKMTLEDISILQLVTNQIGVAIRNAESYSQAQERAQYDALLLDISQKIQATSSVESAMQVAVVELGKRMGKKTKIRLSSSQGEALPDGEKEPSSTQAEALPNGEKEPSA